ncbi:MAG: hypothetical protein ACLQVN_22795 [Bryobacteraceae bacterium]
MRENIVFTLFFLLLPPAWAEIAPSGWKVIKDSKGACQIAVPPEWVPFADSTGAAVFEDATTAIAVVTSQPGQVFKPMTEFLQKVLEIPKGKMFENTARRIFYQEKISKNSEDPNAYDASVPGKNGTCSCRVVFLPTVSEDTSKKIVFSLGPVPE